MADPTPTPTPTPTPEPTPTPTPEPTPTPTPEPTPTPSPFYDALSADRREALKAKNFASPDAFADAYLDLEKKIGAKGIIPPGEDATDADRDAFYNALGRPETADKYDLGDFAPPEALDGLWSEDLQGRMLGHLHKAGLSNAQAKSVVEAYAKEREAEFMQFSESAQTAATATTAKLKSTWGAGFDAEMDLANRAVAHAFGKSVDEVKMLRLQDGSYLLDNHALAVAFNKYGHLMQEEGVLDGGGGGRMGMTPDAAKAEIQKLKADGDFQKAFLDESHPEHAAAMRRMNTLHALANSGQQG